MLKWALRLLAAAGVFVVSNVGFGALIFTYTGAPLINEYGEYFGPDDFVSGFVKFDTEPAGSFSADNVVDFEFSAGSLTIASPAYGIVQANFDFASPDIIDSWIFWIGNVTGSQIYTRGSLFTQDGRDEAVSNRGDLALSLGQGTWTAVPEPSSLVLLSLGMIGVGYGCWRRRRVDMMCVCHSIRDTTLDAES
ncbi:MAG: PEP-CTERM sorting domain-containing protein [Pirellulaceae bacterium]